MAASSGATHREGLFEGCRPSGSPGHSRAPACTPPISEEPLRGAGRWGNRPLAATDDAEGIVMRQGLAEVGQNLVDWEWSCRVGDACGPRSYVMWLP